MALRGLRSALKRGGDDPAPTPGGTPAPGASGTPTGTPATGMTYTRGGYVPVRSFNAAATAAPATQPATDPATAPSAAPAAPGAPATGWGPRPAPGPAQRYGNPATGTVPHGWTPLGPAASAAASGSGAATPGAPLAGSTVAPVTGVAATSRCPSCGRAITKGARRCEGCGTRLLLEVPARKASMLLGAGALAGLVVGGVVFGIALPRSPAAAADPAAAASGAPFHVTGNMAAALRGTTALNGRLAAEADELSTALAASSFPVQDVVQVLRRMSTDARAAAAMVRSLDSWPDAASHQAALASFYDELGTELDAGLAASTTSAGSYKATTQTVLATLTKIVDLDAQARVLASAAGIQLPAVTIPAVLLKG